MTTLTCVLPARSFFFSLSFQVLAQVNCNNAVCVRSHTQGLQTPGQYVLYVLESGRQSPALASFAFNVYTRYAAYIFLLRVISYHFRLLSLPRFVFLQFPALLLSSSHFCGARFTIGECHLRDGLSYSYPTLVQPQCSTFADPSDPWTTSARFKVDLCYQGGDCKNKLSLGTVSTRALVFFDAFLRSLRTQCSGCSSC